MSKEKEEQKDKKEKPNKFVYETDEGLEIVDENNKEKNKEEDKDIKK